MKILFLGDVMGRAGRAAVAEKLPGLRDAWKLDFVVVNGENASGGMGLTGAHAKGLFEAGADCVTLGDHAFDQKDMLQAIERDDIDALPSATFVRGYLREVCRRLGLDDSEVVAGYLSRFSS